MAAVAAMEAIATDKLVCTVYLFGCESNIKTISKCSIQYTEQVLGYENISGNLSIVSSGKVKLHQWYHVMAEFGPILYFILCMKNICIVFIFRMRGCHKLRGFIST